MRFLAIKGDTFFQHCYDDSQDRVDVTLGVIDRICEAVGATHVFAETDCFTLRAGEVVKDRKDVADALKAELTAGLALRCLEVSDEALSSSSIEDRRRVLSNVRSQASQTSGLSPFFSNSASSALW